LRRYRYFLLADRSGWAARCDRGHFPLNPISLIAVPGHVLFGCIGRVNPVPMKPRQMRNASI
jgi:hypothetical protein